MPLWLTLLKTYAAACLLLSLGLWLRLPAATPLGLRQRQLLHTLRRWVLVLIVLVLLLLLCACGTAPSPAPTKRPVPAALLVPPKAPMLLVPKTPALTSATSGTTTPPTPKPARLTASATNT